MNAFVKESPIGHWLLAETKKIETGETPVLRSKYYEDHSS